MRLLVTGGCGFIGSHFIRHVLESRGDSVSIVNLDKLTYAANPANLADIAHLSRYRFVRGDIVDPDVVGVAMEGCDAVVNFAAETHVDRSLLGDASFIETDVRGVFVLLEEAKRRGVRKFIQISTDEVYGSIPAGSFTEESPLNPRNPYAASKAGGDRLAYSYWASYGMPVVITRPAGTPSVLHKALTRAIAPISGSTVGSGALYCHVVKPAVGVKVQVRPSPSGAELHGNQMSPA